MAESNGLLDFLNSPGGMGLLSAVGAGLAGARRGGTWNAVGSGLLGGVQGYAQGQDLQRQNEYAAQRGKLFDMQAQQLEAAQAAAKAEAEKRGKLNDYLGTIGQYKDDFSTQQNQYDPMEFIRRGGSVEEAGKLGEFFNPKPMSVKEGESLINPKTFEPVFTAPKQAAPTELARLTQEMNALPPGSPLRGAYQAMINKTTTHAPGTNVNLAVNTEKSLLNTMAQGLGNQLDNSLASAKSAVNTINTAGRIRELVNSGKIIVGPGADYRVTLARLGDMMGVSGKDNAEKLSNTASLVQSLAQSELEAAQGMKGQGQITEAERSILRRAASGDFNMSGPELISLSNAMDKVGRYRIQSHKSQVQRLNSLPGAAPLVPFYSVDEPTAPQGGQGNDLAAAARAELERRKNGGR